MFRKILHSNKWYKSDLAVILFLAVFTIIVLAPVLIDQTRAFFMGQDNVHQFYTWYQKLSVGWHNGYLPIWNSNVYGGGPFAAEMQPGVLYPLNLLWVALFGSARGISENALNWLVALHYWIAAIGAYLLAKELKVKKWVAYAAGITFAFSGMIAGRSGGQTAIFFALAYITYPVLFLIKFHKSNKKLRYGWLILAGFFLSLTLLAGHGGPFFYALIVVAIFEAAYVFKNINVKNWWRQILAATRNLALILMTAFVVALPQIIISAPYLSNSYRLQTTGFTAPSQKLKYLDYSSVFIVSLSDFANMIDPMSYGIIDGNSLFIGLVPLVSIAIVFMLYRKKLSRTETWQQYSLFIKTLIVTSFLAMIGYATWFAVVLYKTPFVHQIREPARYSVIFNLGLVLVFAATLELLVNERLNRKQRIKLLLIGVFLLINFVYLYMLRERIFNTNLALGTGLVSMTFIVLALIEKKLFRQIIILGIIMITAVCNGLMFLPNPKYRQKPLVPSIYEIPSELARILTETNGKYRVTSREGALPVNIGNVYDFQTTGGYSATIYAPYFEFTRKSKIDKATIDDLLGIQFVVLRNPPAGAQIVYADKENKVYVIKRDSALSKIFAVKQAGSTNRADYYSLDVATLKYNDMHQEYSLSLDKPTQVILSEVYYPGWVAKVDGKPVEITEYSVGNYKIFKSLQLPAGTHSINLDYKPFKML